MSASGVASLTNREGIRRVSSRLLEMEGISKSLPGVKAVRDVKGLKTIGSDSSKARI